MKIIGVIAEYNPFHFGHLYQIKKIKERYPDSLIIAIVSPCFTQRGDISVINKWDKTNICLEHGIDLVVELPTLYATQSADMFAYGALRILNDLGVNTLVFGTECDDINKITKLANIQVNNRDYDALVKKYLDQGINYPSAMSKALDDVSNEKISEPNDLLGLSYVKEIIKNNYNIIPESIKRTNNYHDKVIKGKIINAGLIRDLINRGDNISKYVPNMCLDVIYNNANISNAYNLLLYAIASNRDHLNEYLDVLEGIENKIFKAINKSSTWDELVKNIKTKRYTYNRINRMLIHILLGIKKTDNNNNEFYTKILGFNDRGQKYLSSIKKKINYPLVYGYKPNINSILDMEFRCNYIYSIIVNDMSLVAREFKNKPIVK